MKNHINTPPSGDGSGIIPGTAHLLRLRRLRIDTYFEPVIYMRSDCHVCRAEGFEAQARVRVDLGEKHLIATLNVIHDNLLERDQAALSESAWRQLGASEGQMISVAHAEPVQSESLLRAKAYGHRLVAADIRAIVDDVVEGRYSDLQLAGLITACAGDHMDNDETIYLTRAMIETGQQLHWDYPVVCDKHCVGGLPGNRTTPILVAIAAACGLRIPKTSSRAITSPAGTADTMETMAPVDLDLATMRRVVENEGGCIVWGGQARLSPADDILIRVERALDFDSEGQLVASVLSKKAAAGSTHVVIDIPVGPTAKVRTSAAAQTLAQRFELVGAALGMKLRIIETDGLQPVGQGVGPALEAWDVRAVLQGQPDAPQDLRERALDLAGAVLELGKNMPAGAGREEAARALDDGRAWNKFMAICEAQGGARLPPRAKHTYEVTAAHEALVTGFDNRRLAKLAKLAGAPRAPAAGLKLHVRAGQHVLPDQPLFTLHAEASGELAYALDYLSSGHWPLLMGDPA